MKERPILFTGPMVRALLDGSKTQTRRTVKMPTSWDCIVYADYGDGWWPFRSDDGESPNYDNNQIPLNCPYGHVGDRLWVKEQWRVGAWRGPAHDRNIDHWIAVDYKTDGFARKEWLTCDAAERLAHQSVDDAVKAGATLNSHGRYSWAPGMSPCRWRHARFMPRAASRILLEITGVRVERLQDISDPDALAEGCSTKDMRHGDRLASVYARLWESINGTGSWDANPWVWVVEFRRVAP